VIELLEENQREVLALNDLEDDRRQHRIGNAVRQTLLRRAAGATQHLPPVLIHGRGFGLHPDCCARGHPVEEIEIVGIVIAFRRIASLPDP
jgi:hypothetical protein